MRGLRLANQRILSQVAAGLSEGHDEWFVALGTSMTPAIKAVQRVHLRPVGPDESLRGLVVLARVNGRFWLHRVTDEQHGQVHIAGDNGMINGWTPRREAFGVVV